jgi:hypothetical protein
VTDVDERGENVPYYEIDRGRSVWAATACGALADDLVQRLQRESAAVRD